MGLNSQILRLKSLFGGTVCGILVSLATGLVENGPKFGLPELKHYGFPLVWRVTDLNGPTEYMLANFAIDTAFWIAICFSAFFILEKIVLPKLEISVNYRAFFFPLVLFVPLGLVIDFVHEFGHAVWGTAVGGRLAYMKVTFLEIYPRFALTSQFVLGYVSFEGLTGSNYGVFLLGGALTTNIVAWVMALILLKMNLGNRTRIALNVLGLFGIFDLPFYVVFPQIGLQHWIFLGGCQPEPLLGARMMGIPDPIFYLMVVLTTFGLIFLYFKPLREKTAKIMKMLLARYLYVIR